MHKRTITYTDYDGNVRTEDFYFNLTTAEITKMDLSAIGGLEKRLRKLVEKQDAPGIMKTFEELIHQSYGEKSEDGRRFIKSDELSTAFEQTEAYSELFMQLCTDAEEAVKFVKAIMPAKIASEMEKQKSDIVDLLPSKDAE